MREHLLFPCRKKKKKKKKHVRVQNAIKRLLCCNGCYDSDFPLLHSHSQADEKESQKKTSSTPLSNMPATPADSFGSITFTGVGGRGSSLMFGAKHLPHHQQNVKGPTDWPLSLLKSTLHNANCTSAAITFPC